MADFATALQVVLGHEGGLQGSSLDAGNVGGSHTNHGITLATLTSWRALQGLPAPSDQDIVNLSDQETAAIYQAMYWIPSGGERIIDQAVATVLFDAGVVMGVATVVRFAQAVAAAVSKQAISGDGQMGPKTASAINSIQRRAFLEPLCYRLQGHFLDCIAARPENSVWERVWLRRAADWLSLIY